MNISSETIVLSPVDPIGEELLRSLAEGIGWAFKLKTCVVTLLDDIEFAFHPGRMQYHSTAILNRLAAELPRDQLRVLGLTSYDLFIPILTHVYGEAQLGGRAGIVSTYRLQEGLDPEPFGQEFQTRVLKEAIHELGHTFDLRHCPDATCIMHYCRSLGDVDRKENRFCRYCQVLLEDSFRRGGS